jgi:phosphatidyl-myo-inositol dimannoside synthase
MCVGEAVGLPGIDGQRDSVMAQSGLRILALVTDAFGGHGGIAQYNRDFFSALAGCDRVGEVIVLPRAAARLPDRMPSGVRQLRPVKGRLAYSFAALEKARVHRPIDLVFCGHLFMLPLAAVVAKLLKAGLWVQVHGLEAWEELSGLRRRLLESAMLVTSVSRYTRRRLLEWAAMDPARVKVLPNTVDPQYQPGLKPAYLIARHAAGGRKVLMTVSRLAASEQMKGQDRVIRTLPRVLSEHPGAIYLIVGDGDDRPRLEALATQTGVAKNVQFAGLVPPEELPDYFRLADVFVMPSTCEGFGIVFLEAMATGIPVIGGNKDGSLDPLADGVLGIAVDPQDDKELASAICAALNTAPANVDRASRFKVQAFTEHLQTLVWSSLSAPN